MKTAVYESTRTNSRFIVSGEEKRAFLAVEGEAAVVSKVQRQCDLVRRGGGTFEEVCWMARQLARDY